MKFKEHNFKTYHLHFYYNESNIEYAKSLGQEIKKLYQVELGRFHERPVGPHPMWSVQLTLDRSNLYDALSFSIQNREDLIFFIHPVSGDDLKDHTDYATWVGEKQELDLSIFH